MTHRMYGALIASLGAIALMFAADPTFARPGAAVHSGSVSSHAVSHRSVAFRSFRHARRNHTGGVWLGDGSYYGPSNGEPMLDGTQPASRDIRTTDAYDIPWDWAHRYPPAVVPSGRPYVPGCTAEPVTVPGRGGGDRTVNVMRCY